MSWTTASCKAWGRGTTTAGATTWADKTLGTWIESQANISSLTGAMPRRKVWIQSKDGLSPNGDEQFWILLEGIMDLMLTQINQQ